MREVILKMSISIDGFVGSADSGVHWIFDSYDPEATAWTVETVWNASLHIMGSRTFHDMAAFWPTSTEVFAPPMNQIPKAVFTKRGPASLTAAAHNTAALGDARANAGPDAGTTLQPGHDTWRQAYVASDDLAEEIAKLKTQDGKPIVAHGGAGFARGLIASGLVDQYALLVHPIALGKGMPIFADLIVPKPLKLISSKVFPKGAVAQIYRPA